MQRRLFLFLLSILSYTGPSSGGEYSAWNCEQSKDGKEWICSGNNKSNNAPQDSVPKKEMPVISEKSIAIENFSGIETEKSVVVEHPLITNVDIPVVVERSTLSTIPEVEKADVVTKPNITITEKSSSVTSISGEWQCDSSKNNDWNCQQIKKSNANFKEIDNEVIPTSTKIVSSATEGLSHLRIMPPAFDSAEEQTFSVLRSQLKIDPWQHCNNPNVPKSVPLSKNKSNRDNAPINLTSNYSEIFENEISSYFGNVQIQHSDQQMSSNAANYDSVSKKLDVQGDVYYSDNDMSVHTNSASFNMSNDQAKLHDVLFIEPTLPLRGHAGVVHRKSKTVSRYQDVAYTSCPTGNQDWVIHASDLEIDKEDGHGVAHDMWLEFKGTPIFYSPYLSFPTDNRRTSGFLAPSFGTTQRSGFHIGTPYYWNIAPNYDATFKPRYLAKRGLMLAGEFRYLTEESHGQTSLEVLPNDYLRNNQSRYFGSVKDSTKLTDKIQTNVDLNYVSDKNYFAELGSALSMPNFSYLKSQIDAGYYGDSISAVGRVENYQSIDKYLTGSKLPYRKLPQFNVNLKHGFDELPIPVNVAMDNEFVYFQHNSLLNGQRSNFKPSISLPIHSESAYITPKVSFQFTNYFLSDPLNSGSSTQISRSLPIFSADSGMTFERHLNLDGKSFLNTLEPRFYYLYIPRKNQSDIPLFDTAAYDIWLNTLFRENRFSGIDRMQDANQVTAAMTSRLVDEKTGKERAKFSFGNVFYFQNREVQAPFYLQKLNSAGQPVLDAMGQSVLNTVTPPTETTRFSNLIGELSTTVNEHISFDSGIQFDPYQHEISRGKALLHLTNKPNEILNLGYRYRKISPSIVPNRANDIIQSDVSFHYPVYDDWSAIGRWQYSWLYNSTQESFIGIEKENCCWRFRVVGRRYINNLNVFYNGADVQGVSQTGIFFQVELKGLTGMGENLNSFLEQSIYGYRAK